MASRVILHVGAMKSGTSFLQNVLAAHREQLAADGVLFPGSSWAQQVRAVRDLADHVGAGQPPLAPDGPWRRLVDEINAWQGTVIVSMEFLGPRRRDQIELVRDAFPGSELRVVLTARDLARTVPAMWQESVQNAKVTTWPDFLEAVRAEEPKRPGPGKWFWKHQRLALMARRWSETVGRENFVLVTVPPPGSPPELLWERFAGVAGLDPTAYRLDVRSNPSIGAASAMVMRALNEALADDPIPPGTYDRYVKHALAKQGLALRSAQEPVLAGLDQAWVRQRARLEVKRLRQQDVQVVGDLDELIPTGPVMDPSAASVEVGTEEQLAAAVDALAVAVRLIAQLVGAQDQPGDESVEDEFDE